MKKYAFLAVLLLCIAAVAASGCITMGDEKPIDYATALIGDWKSTGTYLDGDTQFTMVYHFKEGGDGTLDKVVDGKVTRTINIAWQQYENNIYAVGYLTSMTLDYLYMSEDGSTLMNEDQQYFVRL